MGTATARALGTRGVDAVLMEQFAIGHTLGSSHGPTRIFRIAYPMADYARMSVRSLPLWRELEAAAGEELLVTTGGLDCGVSATLCSAALDEIGVGYEWLTPQGAEERFPAIAFRGLDPILYQPDAAVCLADRTVAAQARLAAASGVEVREGCRALAIHPLDDRVRVETDQGEVESRAAVVTAGTWADRLLGGAGSVLPLKPILQTIAYFGPRPDQADAADRFPTYIHWDIGDGDRAGLAWYALGPAGHAPGVKLGQHIGGVQVDPREGPFDPSPDSLNSLSAYVAERFPGLDPEPVSPQTCLYTMTPDEDFVLDRIGPVVIGAGFSGHGFKFTPLVGEVLADLATGRDPGIPPERFAADRRSLAAT